jgi:hypothetical protein
MLMKKGALEAHGCKLLLGASGRSGSSSKGPGPGFYTELQDPGSDVTMSDMSVDL